MRKIAKITNIALIFILISVFLRLNACYSSTCFNLRPGLEFNSDKKITASERFEEVLRKRYGGKTLGVIELEKYAKQFGFTVPYFDKIGTEVFNELLQRYSISRKDIEKGYTKYDNLANYTDIEEKNAYWDGIKALFHNAEFTKEQEVLLRGIFDKIRAKKFPVIAIRSSSVLEDGKKYRFKGTYESEMLAFSEDAEKDFNLFKEKIKMVYSTIFSFKARNYRKVHNIPDEDEMGILVQALIGSVHEDNKFYPMLSGVTLFEPYAPEISMSYINAGLNTKTVRAGAGYEWRAACSIDPNGKSHFSGSLATQDGKIIIGRDDTFDYFSIYYNEVKSGSIDNISKYDKTISVLAPKIDRIIRAMRVYREGPVELEWSEDKGNLYVYQCRYSYNFKELYSEKIELEEVLPEKIIAEARGNMVLGHKEIDAQLIYAPGIVDLDEIVNDIPANLKSFILAIDLSRFLREYYSRQKYEITALFFSTNFPGLSGVLDISDKPFPLGEHWAEDFIDLKIPVISTSGINKKLLNNICEKRTGKVWISRGKVRMAVDGQKQIGRIWVSESKNTRTEFTKDFYKETINNSFIEPLKNILGPHLKAIILNKPGEIIEDSVLLVIIDDNADIPQDLKFPPFIQGGIYRVSEIKHILNSAESYYSGLKEAFLKGQFYGKNSHFVTQMRKALIEDMILDFKEIDMEKIGKLARDIIDKIRNIPDGEDVPITENFSLYNGITSILSPLDQLLGFIAEDDKEKAEVVEDITEIYNRFEGFMKLDDAELLNKLIKGLNIDAPGNIRDVKEITGKARKLLVNIRHDIRNGLFEIAGLCGKNPDEIFKAWSLNQVILQQQNLYINKLQEVKEKGDEALSSEIKALMDNPDSAELGKNFTPITYYLIYSRCMSYSEIFSKQGSAQFKNLMAKIIQAAALKEFEKISKPGESEILKKHIYLVSTDSDERRKEIQDEHMDLLIDAVKLPEQEKDTLFKYLDILYNINTETLLWVNELLGPDGLKKYGDFGQDDEKQEFWPGCNVLTDKYLKSSGKLRPPIWAKAGQARYCTLHGDIDKAIKIFHNTIFPIFFQSEASAKRFFHDNKDKLISLIEKEISWMAENKLDGIEKMRDFLETIKSSGEEDRFIAANAPRSSILRVPFIQAQRLESIREYFERRKDIVGGKGAWNEVLEQSAKEIKFNTSVSIRLTIQEVWDKFTKDKENKKLIDKGNALIDNDIKRTGKVTEKTLLELNDIIRNLFFPKSLEKFIVSKTKNLKGKVIIRLCGKNEDSYIRNLAGVFTSPKKDNEKLIVQGIKEAFLQAIELIWIKQNSSENPRESISNKITSDEGFAIDVQSFIDFDASGTANTDVYGHTSIEAVIGDASSAVKTGFPSTVRYMFKNRTNEFEFEPSFIDMPYEFTLKEKKFCIEDDSAALREVMKKYPKINNIFSPIEQDMAIELNRVVSGLREKIGIPIDIEWGVVDGKLYIIQVRPIIGDFNKNLVEPSPELADKKLIAETHLTRGQTSPEGFTGKVVLLGYAANDEEIREFEKEFNEPYIRIQNDAAGSVVSLGSTKAKVLVDVSEGSLQAHCVDEITNRISDGEFAYANGPRLRQGFMKKLHFIPHPDFKKVWISIEDVTYFSSGLNGKFYLSGARPYEKLDVRQDILCEFKSRMSLILSGDLAFDRNSEYEKLLKLIFGKDKGYFMEEEKNTFDLLLGFIKQMANSGKKLKNLDETDYAALEKTPEIKAYLRVIEPKARLLKEALSFPLYPREWEDEYMKSLNYLLILDDLREVLNDREKKNIEKKPRVPIDMYTAMFFNHKEATGINYKIPEANLKAFDVESTDSIESELKKIDYKISFLWVHVHHSSISQLIRTFKKVREVNPDAKIYIDSGDISPAEFELFQAGYGKISIYKGGYFRTDDICAAIKKDVNRWKEEKEKQKSEPKEVKPAKKPEYPEKLKILYLDDSGRWLSTAKMFLESKIPECEVLTVSNYLRAAGILNSNEVNLAFLDMAVPETTPDEKTLFYNTLESKQAILGAVIISGKDDEKEISKECAKLNFKPLSILRKGAQGNNATNSSLLSIIKKLREKQIQEYEKSLAKWQKTYPEQKAKQMTVLWIDDDPSFVDKAKMRMLMDFGNSKRINFISADNMSQAVKKIKKYKPDLIFFDIALPDEKEGVMAKYIENLKSAKHLVVASLSDFVNVYIQSMFKKDYSRVRMLNKGLEDGEFSKVMDSYIKDALQDFEKDNTTQAETKNETKNIFIVTHLSGDGVYLAGSIEKRFKGKFNIIKANSMAELEKALKDNAPDLVITDSNIDNKEKINEILEMSKVKNPGVKFIITSENAALLMDKPFKGFNILSIVEKPFYSHDVIEILRREVSGQDSIMMPKRENLTSL